MPSAEPEGPMKVRIKSALRAVSALLLLLESSGVSRAEPFASAPVAGRNSSARLLAGAPQADGAWAAGVEIELQPHVVTYWRTPGEAGVPPSFDFAGSTNVDAVRPLYPVPKHIEEAGGVVSGYETRVLFPLVVKPKDPAAAVTLDLNLDYAACDKICLPAKAHLTLTLTRGEASPHAQEIDAALRERVPKTLAASDVGNLLTLKETGEKGAWRLEYRGKGKLLDVFSEAPDPWFLESARNGESFELKLFSVTGARTAPKAPLAAMLTLVTDQGAFEAPVTLQ